MVDILHHTMKPDAETLHTSAGQGKCSALTSAVTTPREGSLNFMQGTDTKKRNKIPHAAAMFYMQQKGLLDETIGTKQNKCNITIIYLLVIFLHFDLKTNKKQKQTQP